MKEAIFENTITKNLPKLMKIIKTHFKSPKQTLNKKKKKRSNYWEAYIPGKRISMLRPEKQDRQY